MPLEPEYSFSLFIVGSSPRSAKALQNIREICALYLVDRHSLTIVDVEQQPERALAEGVFGLPCLIKKGPGIVRRLVGDLSDRQGVLLVLGLA